MAKSLRRQKILLERELTRLVNIGMYEKIEAKYELKNKEAQNIKQFTGFPDNAIDNYYDASLKPNKSIERSKKSFENDFLKQFGF